MAYSTADAERIARLKTATRAAKEIVEQAKVEDHLLVENCETDQPAGTWTGLSVINRLSITQSPDALIRLLFGG